MRSDPIESNLILIALMIVKFGGILMGHGIRFLIIILLGFHSVGSFSFGFIFFKRLLGFGISKIIVINVLTALESNLLIDCEKSCNSKAHTNNLIKSNDRVVSLSFVDFCLS